MITPIYSSPFCEEKVFHFVPAELLPKKDMYDLLEFCKDKKQPIVPPFKYPIYTWDYFAWKRYKENPPKRSINEKGLGYCNYCGRLVKFDKKEDKWQCRKCGALNNRIFDYCVKREYNSSC